MTYKNYTTKDDTKVNQNDAEEHEQTIEELEAEVLAELEAEYAE